jgi:hypothetical protein
MTDPAVDWFAPTILTGEFVRLEPIAVRHLDGLTTAGHDPAIWTWMPADGSTPDGMRDIARLRYR